MCTWDGPFQKEKENEENKNGTRGVGAHKIITDTEMETGKVMKKNDEMDSGYEAE